MIERAQNCFKKRNVSSDASLNSSKNVDKEKLKRTNTILNLDTVFMRKLTSQKDTGVVN